jgi:hypothetical protein
METEVKPTAAQIAKLQTDAGIPHPPTAETYWYRKALSGEGPHAFAWADKPHRLVFDLCRMIEAADASLPIKAGEAVPVAESSRQIIHELAADIRDRMSWEEGSAIWRNAQRIVELSRPASPQPEAYGVRVTDEMVEIAANVMGLRSATSYRKLRAALEAALSHTEQGETK